MPVSWTAERDQRLLLLLVNKIKPNNDQLAKDYADIFGHVDEARPTAKAIAEHIAKLKRTVKGFGGDGVTDGPNTPRKPKASLSRATVSKTPTSSAKRKNAMSDEDDSEPEHLMNGGSKTNMKPHAKSARRSKTPKMHREEKSDEADDESGLASNIKDEYGSGIFKAASSNIDGSFGHSGGAYAHFDNMSDTSQFEI